MTKTVAIGGLGAIGLKLARAWTPAWMGCGCRRRGARPRPRRRPTCATSTRRRSWCRLTELAEADIVVEAAPAAVFEQIAAPAIEAGRIFVPASVGALLPRMHLVRRARQTGARIVVPTGALLGLDAVRAAAEGRSTASPSKAASRRAAWRARRIW